MATLVLPFRLIMPFVLMFSRSLGFKNIRSKVLYLLHPSVRQRHTAGTLTSLSSPHSRQFCLCVRPSLKVWAVGVVWPVSSPTATSSFCLLIARSSCMLLRRGSFIRVLDWRQPLQVFHLFSCSCLKWLLMISLPTQKRMPTIWSEGNQLVPSLANLSASSFMGILW